MRRSPLEGYAARLGALPAGVTVREVPFLTQLSLRVEPTSPEAAAVAKVLGSALPTQPCTSSQSGQYRTLWLGPDEWLVLAPPHHPALEPALRTAVGSAGAVVDVSAQHTTLSVEGPRARDLLAHGCAIDLDPRTSPDGAAFQTLLALTPLTILIQGDRGDAFTLLVRASFARYLADWIVDASEEYQ